MDGTERDEGGSERQKLLNSGRGHNTAVGMGGGCVKEREV